MIAGKAKVAFVTFNSIPERVETHKYSLLGKMTGAAKQAYCMRHGYSYYDRIPDLGGYNACWSKIPALVEALECHEWALWNDSDTLLLNGDLRLESFLQQDCDMLFQEPSRWFESIRINRKRGFLLQPINTGVFMVRRTDWSLEVLRNALDEAVPSCAQDRWNGIGEQEAIIKAIRRGGEFEGHVGYVDYLQDPPQAFRPAALFTHLYGNHASFRYSREQCLDVLKALCNKIHVAPLLPAEIALLHWCSIQNHEEDCPLARGNPSRFGYEASDLDHTMSMLQKAGGISKRAYL